MKLPKLAINNPQFTFVMTALFIILGIVAFLTMPRSEDPQVSPAGSSVVVIYPGASPEDMESLVVDPLEEAINELDDIKKFNTKISDGLSIINVEFQSGNDPEKKYSDVLQKVNRVRNKLPTEIYSLEVVKWSITNVNIMQIALVSDSAEYAKLEYWAEELKNVIERIGGIKNVNTWAYPEQIVDVAIDFEKMAEMHIPLNLVFGAIQSSNANIPGGSIDVGNKKFNIRTSGFFESLDDIRNTVLHARGGYPIRLGDIAQVSFAVDDKNYYARFNGVKSVFITARQKESTNIFDIVENVHQKVEEYGTKLPDDIKMEYVFDQSISVNKRLTVFFGNLFQGMLLVGFVVFLFFGLRASAVIAFAIPTSIIIAVGFVDLSGYGLEQMSIAALVIALGLLVDNAIVITENISRFINRGDSPADAAIAGTSEVAWAVVSSTVTTVFAFIPMILIQNITGDFIRSMPVTVVFALTVSLFIALTVTPLLSKKILKKENGEKKNKVKHILTRFIETEYRKRLDYVLRHPKRILLIATVIFFASLSLFPIVGVSFFPKAEKPQFMIKVITPDGSSLAYSDSVAQRVERELSKYDLVKFYAANIGRSNPQVYYNVIERRPSSNYAEFFIQLKEFDREKMNDMLDGLRTKFARPLGARIEIKEFAQGPPVEAPIAIKVMGKNLDIIKRLSRDVEGMIRGEVGTINVNNPLATSATDIQVHINRDKAGILGIPIVDIDKAVRTAVTGLTISNYRDDEGKDYDIVVRLPYDKRPNRQDLNRIYLTTSGGEAVPLSQLTDIRFKETPSVIYHYKMDRNMTVTADVLDDYSVTELTNNIIDKLDKYEWPQGYYYVVGGEVESQAESMGGMGKAVIIALIAILGVLVLQFKSLTQPLIIFTAIPLAFVGSVLALLITGYSFSFTAFVGLTSLVGIVINNSIILVDYTNQLRSRGHALREAIKEASETRFLPIVLTTATTIGGLLPLTLGGGTLWAPMGWTIIGGLLVSTLLTLIVVPVLYEIFSGETK